MLARRSHTLPAGTLGWTIALKNSSKRVRQMSARIAQIQKRLAETNELIARDRENTIGSPLNNVRDVRPWSAPGHSRETEPIERGDV
jgi:hypothetical protein